MSQKSLVDEMHQVQLAIELIELGARLQVLETETELSRTRLIKLYKEVRGMSPPKGLLKGAGCERIDAFVKAYRLYEEQISLEGVEPVLGLTRAWTLVRFFESDLLQLTTCTRCEGRFVAHAHSPTHDYVCGICQPPSRAGKTRKAQR